MKLHRQAREFYVLEIVTIPAVTGWEASFNGGTTWVAATDTGNGYCSWLVAGPGASTSGAGVTVTQLTTDTTPLVRAIDNPAIHVKAAPIIGLVGNSAS